MVELAVESDQLMTDRQTAVRGLRRGRVETVILLLLVKWPCRKTNASYLGTESLALCEASSVELTYSLTYTKPLKQEAQLGSEIIGCILYIVHLFHCTTSPR